MKIALIGCGYVADMYVETLAAYPQLELLGVYDRDGERLSAFSRFHRLTPYASLAALLADPRLELAVNLTDPRSHYEVSHAALQAGRHVYSEKPLAMTLEQAEELASLAGTRGLSLAAAPCNHLSPAVQTLARELRAARLGRVLLAQAEMDDGMVPGLDYTSWRSASGAPWPARDEFEIGCTMEHAGYQIAPLVTLFGPVRQVTAFSICALPEKGRDVGVSLLSPDLSIGVLEFAGGVVARLTNSILAPSDRMLRVVGTGGVATLTDLWDYHAPVRITATGASPRARVARKLETRLSPWLPRLLLGRAARAEAAARVRRTGGGHRMDFARGIAEQARRIEAGASPLAAAELAVHVTEVTLALQAGAGRSVMRSQVNEDK